jgi:hypothetical protein
LQSRGLETSRGWRIAKTKSSRKIDVVVALAQAALLTAKVGSRPPLCLAWGQELDRKQGKKTSKYSSTDPYSKPIVIEELQKDVACPNTVTEHFS